MAIPISRQPIAWSAIVVAAVWMTGAGCTSRKEPEPTSPPTPTVPSEPPTAPAPAGSPATRPAVSEEIAALDPIAPTARDGHRGEGFLRKPPGTGPFPAVVLIHGGLERWPTPRLKEYALGAWPSRYLAAGYVVAVITYRSRDVDPQSREPLDDALAAIDHVRKLAYVDPKSVIVNGTSGGGHVNPEPSRF